MKPSSTRNPAQEARWILIASGALGVASGLVDRHFGHDILALFGFAAGVLAVVLYPFRSHESHR